MIKIRKLCLINQKDFLVKDKDDKYFPPIKVLRIPLHIFEERKQVQEIVDFEDEEDII